MPKTYRVEEASRMNREAGTDPMQDSHDASTGGRE